MSNIWATLGNWNEEVVLSMSVRAVVVCLLVVLLIPLAAWADFQNGQNASIVIGQSDFNAK